MEKLFKCTTVKQRKIMEWLVCQGITAADVAEAKLSAPGMVRVTNSAGQYMDVYCNDSFQVRILDVAEAREGELLSCFWNETNDPETEEWRENLTADEVAMVEQWDEQYLSGYQKLAQACLDLRHPTEGTEWVSDYEPEI